MSNVTLISDSDIDKLYSRASAQEKSIFDCKADFFSLMSGSPIMCSVPIKVVGMRRGYTEDGPFFIDFAVETPTKGVHTLHSNVRVLYLSLECRDGLPADSVGFCRPEEVDELFRISSEVQP